MSIWSEHAAREREKAMSDDLGDEWMPFDRAVQWLKAHIGEPRWLMQNWDCKYMDARIDMRLGTVFLRPGNPNAKPELAPGGTSPCTEPNRSAPESGIGAASQVVTNLRSTLENAINDLDTAIERECMEDVGIVVAYMREALAAPDEPKVPHPNCAAPVPNERIWQIQKSFVAALEKGDPNYMVDMEWNEGVSIINEMMNARLAQNRRGEPT